MKKIFMGNEAIALGAIRAGVSVVSGYPGTPSTQILETVAKEAAMLGGKAAGLHVEWSVNEKAALEVAAGAALSGVRAMVTMNQAGINVASDPLMSLSCLASGGLVVIAADDPGTHFSPAEQDSRHFARYAKLIVFDPSSVEEAYLMVADAFDFSEKYDRPVILRPTTRICHGFASVDPEILPLHPKKIRRGFAKSGYPGLQNSIQQDQRGVFSPPALGIHEKIEADLPKMRADFSAYRGNSLIVTPNVLGHQNDDSLPSGGGILGIAAGGISYAYAMEILSPVPPGLKILKVGTLPFPVDLALNFLEGLDEVLVLEELDPMIEDELLKLCGSRHLRAEIRGKRSGDMPRVGDYGPGLAAEKIEAFLKRKIWVHISELEKENLPHPAAVIPPIPASPASVAPATLAAAAAAADVQTQPPPEPPSIPSRPPFLCNDCPHRLSFSAVKEAVRKYGKGRKTVFSGDLGCYALGNAKPFEMIDTCLCMGAGITMAQGISRSDPGVLSIAFIGDATFFHSGIAGLVNAVYNRSNIIVIVLDNGSSAVTGNQGHPGTGINALGKGTEKISISALAAALGIKDMVRIDPNKSTEAEAAIAGLIEKTGVRLVIFEAPCVVRSIQGNSTVDASSKGGPL